MTGQKLSSYSLAALSAIVLFSDVSRAEVKIIEADGLYVLGGSDSRTDAKRIATLDAQRKALEHAGTFAVSLPQVKEYRLTKDQITAYTAGIVETEIVADEARGTLEQPELYLKARCRVDTDVLARQIGRYREQEELRELLETAAKEREALRKERGAIQKQLTVEQDRAKADDARQRIGTVLTGEEGIEEASRAWAMLAPRIDFYGGTESRQEIPAADLEAAMTALRKAIAADPGSVRARVLLASVHHQQGDRDAAEGELRAALQRAPNNALAHLRLGIVLREQGKYPEAFREFRFIEHRRPNMPQMLFQTGLTHRSDGNCRMAVGYMKRLLMYTKRNDRPEIVKLKPAAKAVIEECGDQPAPKKKKRQ